MLLDPTNDPDEFDAIVQAIADRAAVDPAFRLKLDAAAREARRWCGEMEACGLIRIVPVPGGIAIEMLARQVH